LEISLSRKLSAVDFLAAGKRLEMFKKNWPGGIPGVTSARSSNADCRYLNGIRQQRGYSQDSFAHATGYHRN
jgi:hypothetical protein